MNVITILLWTKCSDNLIGTIELKLFQKLTEVEFMPNDYTGIITLSSEVITKIGRH